MGGLSDNERILGFVEDWRDAHVAPYPVGLRVVQAHTGLSMHRVRTGVDQLLQEGRLTKMKGYPDYGVVQP
jgi:hypothetical protein